MAYIHHSQQQHQQQAGVMSGVYHEIQMNDSDEKSGMHIVSTLATNDPSGHQNESEGSSTIEQHTPNTRQLRHHHHQQQQQQQQSSSRRDNNCNGDDANNNLQSASGSSSEERHEDGTIVLQANQIEGGGMIVGLNKTPNSYKYPLLSKYYQFGPWIGRNRKAICLGCQLQTSSSQPDRLLKHLNKCAALSEKDKVAVQELMNERTANKRRKPEYRGGHKDDDGNQTTDYYDEDDEAGTSDHALNASQIGSAKRAKREPKDRKGQIDEALTRFIMACRIPLKAIHSKEFVELVHALDPTYRIPSRETITNVLIPGLLNII